MSRFGTFGIILATSVALAATPALAIIKVATITGVITSGSDQIGLFGAANANLAGKAYTVSLTYDTSAGTRFFEPGEIDEIQGNNTLDSSKNLFLHASATVNGVSYKILTNFHEFVGICACEYYYTDPIIYTENYLEAHGVDSTPLTTIGQYNFTESIRSYTLSPIRTINSELNTQGIATFLKDIACMFCVSRTTKISADGLSTELTIFKGTADSFSISDPVPEPANWAMMIAGFGLVGATQRRRRLSARSVAA
jgi:hypothetical protein